MFALTLKQWFVDTAAVAGSIATIVMTVPIVMRSPLGRLIRFMYHRLWKEPLSTGLTKRATTIVEDVVGPQLDAIRADAARLETKNDSQHAGNLKVITDLGIAVHSRLDRIEEVLIAKQRKPKPAQPRVVQPQPRVIQPPDSERFDCV